MVLFINSCSLRTGAETSGVHIDMIDIRGDPLQLENKEARNSSNIVAGGTKATFTPKTYILKCKAYDKSLLKDMPKVLI